MQKKKFHRRSAGLPKHKLIDMKDSVRCHFTALDVPQALMEKPSVNYGRLSKLWQSK